MGKFEKNHFFPNYNLKYWKEIHGKLNDKTKIEKKDYKFNPKNNFYLHKYYYFDGTPELEKRLVKIESRMSEILKKISVSTNKNSVELSEYQINFIQLFLFLQTYRQLLTTEVIKNDQSRLYKSNDYLFGVFNIKNRDEMQTKMYSLVDALENIMKEENSKNLAQWMRVVFNTHLVIAKNNDSQICQSDSCCIIRNDMYSNNIYTYFPQTPKLSFFLVNTKYFLQEKNISNYLAENGIKYICSILLDQSKNLVCQYDKPWFDEQTKIDFFLDKPITSFQQLKDKKILLSFIELSKNEIDSYNRILFDDCKKFIYSQDYSYIPYLQSLSANFHDTHRHDIPINIKNGLPFFLQPFLAYNPDRKDIQSDQLCKRIQDLSINPRDIIFVNFLLTKKGSIEEQNVKKELISWLDNMQEQNNFNRELVLSSQDSLSDDQIIKSGRAQLTKGLSKSEIAGLKSYIESFDDVGSQNSIGDDIERADALKWFFNQPQFKNINSDIIDQQLFYRSVPNFLSFKQEKNKGKQFTEKNSNLAGISWVSGFKKQNEVKILKIDNLKNQSQNNSNQILDLGEIQPEPSGLTREELQRIQEGQSVALKGLEPFEIEL